MNNYYILMADIIDSRKKSSKSVMKDFLELVAKINSEYKHCFLSPMTITLGDEFQGVAASLADGIGVILAMEEATIHLNSSFKLRYVLNYGQIDTKINPKIAYGMLGEGLTESRRLLEKNKSKKNRFFVKIHKEELSEKLALVFILYQAIVDSWALRNYPIVKEFLLCDDYKKVANKIKKNISQSWKLEKSLQITEYQAVKQLIFLLLRETPCPK
jgi:hypothetical protein